MPLWTQHLLVLLMVAACIALVFRSALLTFRGRGKLGACCSRGCPPRPADVTKAAERVVFIPADSLLRRKRQRTAEEN